MKRLAALLLVGALTACGTAEAPPERAASESTVITHAYGETRVPADPQRVVTWGWGSADAAIALGTVPVAIPHQAYGGDGQGVLPWVRTALEERGAAVPTVLPDQQEVPVEAIAAADPDLVLAPYSGITRTEYEQLSRIAPTVAFPDQPWATPWRDTVRIVGEALGKGDAAQQLLDGVDARIAEQAAAHPELEGRTVAMTWKTPDAFYVYKPADARVQFTEDLGLTTAPSVTALASGTESFYYVLSPERLDELDADVLVSYFDTPQAEQQFLASPEARLLPQVARGAVATVVGQDRIAAVGPPTALSLTYGLEGYVDALATAVRAAR